MTDPVAARAASLLIKARAENTPIAALPEDCRPADERAAYAAQAAHVEALCRHLGARTIGYKIGATGEGARRLLKTDHPFYGRLLDKLTLASPAVIPAAEARMKVVEAEFAFRLSSPLVPRPAPFTRADLLAAIDAVLPAIELVDSRYAVWTEVGILSVVADQGSHGHWIHGAAVTDWRGFDLSSHAVRLEVNGRTERHGSGSAVMGDPVEAVLWLANTLRAEGTTLPAGSLITSGTATDVYPAKAGDRLLADFGPLGSAALTLA